ncbi:hypothetical protein B0H11DRAFT_2266608 [Mycena galericulata]|nr:hypothetical protein B0H11DRAFT_2266608 [Mycena galericulata]
MQKPTGALILIAIKSPPLEDLALVIYTSPSMATLDAASSVDFVQDPFQRRLLRVGQIPSGPVRAASHCRGIRSRAHRAGRTQARLDGDGDQVGDGGEVGDRGGQVANIGEGLIYNNYSRRGTHVESTFFSGFVKSRHDRASGGAFARLSTGAQYVSDRTPPIPCARPRERTECEDKSDASLDIELKSLCASHQYELIASRSRTATQDTFALPTCGAFGRQNNARCLSSVRGSALVKLAASTFGAGSRPPFLHGSALVQLAAAMSEVTEMAEQFLAPVHGSALVQLAASVFGAEMVTQCLASVHGSALVQLAASVFGAGTAA